VCFLRYVQSTPRHYPLFQVSPNLIDPRIVTRVRTHSILAPFQPLCIHVTVFNCKDEFIFIRCTICCTWAAWSLSLAMLLFTKTTKYGVLRGTLLHRSRTAAISPKWRLSEGPHVAVRPVPCFQQPYTNSNVSRDTSPFWKWATCTLQWRERTRLVCLNWQPANSENAASVKQYCFTMALSFTLFSFQSFRRLRLTWTR
jgi:hypothetical protein